MTKRVPSYRSTGRSFRAITQALLKASAGKNVVFVTSRSVTTSWCFIKAADMVRAYGIYDIEVIPKRRMIDFPGNGGSIRFVMNDGTENYKIDCMMRRIKNSYYESDYP